MKRMVLAAMLLLWLGACTGGNIPVLITTPIVSPSPLPAILSPTPPFIPSSTSTPLIYSPSPTLGQTPSITSTETVTSTFTPASTSTFTPKSTFTPPSTLISTSTPTATLLSGLFVEIPGCNTSLDILHQMGEVTNAFPIIENSSRSLLTNVCATLSASDEARLHPDKTACVAELPTGFQVTLKLTVDTGFEQDTSIQVGVKTAEGLNASASRPSCADIGLPGWLPDKVGVIEPIQ